MVPFLRLRFVAVIPLILFACGTRTQEPILAPVVAISTIDAVNDVGLYPSLVTGRDGQARVSYYDQTYGDLKFAKQAADGHWQAQVIDSAGDVGGHSSLALDRDDKMVLLYRDDTQRQAKIALGDRRGFRIVPMSAYADTPLNSGQFCSVAVGHDGIFRFTFVLDNDLSSSLTYTELNPKTRALSGIGLPDEGGRVDRTTSLQLRSIHGRPQPVITYYQAGHGELRLAYREPGHPVAPSDGIYKGWVKRLLSASTLDEFNTRADIGYHSDATLETEADILHVSAYDADRRRLRYVRYDFATDTTTVEEIPTEAATAPHSSIVLLPAAETEAIGAQYVPAVAMSVFGRDGERTLTLATRDAVDIDGKVGWRTFEIDKEDRSVMWPSLARLDNKRRLAIAYRSDAAGSLKYATVQPLN